MHTPSFRIYEHENPSDFELTLCRSNGMQPLSVVEDFHVVKNLCLCLVVRIIDFLMYAFTFQRTKKNSPPLRCPSTGHDGSSSLGSRIHEGGVDRRCSYTGCLGRCETKAAWEDGDVSQPCPVRSSRALVPWHPPSPSQPLDANTGPSPPRGTTNLGVFEWRLYPPPKRGWERLHGTSGPNGLVPFWLVDRHGWFEPFFCKIGHRCPFLALTEAIAGSRAALLDRPKAAWSRGQP